MFGEVGNIVRLFKSNQLLLLLGGANTFAVLGSAIGIVDVNLASALRGAAAKPCATVCVIVGCLAAGFDIIIPGLEACFHLVVRSL